MPDEVTYMKRLSLQIQTLFDISTEMQLAFPGRKFTFDGHLVGSISEVIAAFHHDLKLLLLSSERHDATTSEGQNTQI
jgi:hypothetical protein